MSAPRSGADLLARIQPTRKEVMVELCLRPDLLEEWEAAQQRLSEALVDDGAKGRLSSGGTSAASKKRAAEVVAIEVRIEEVAARFYLRGMPKDEWRALCDNHPPRKGNDMDFMAGYDRDGVADAAVRACMYDPIFEDCTELGCDHEKCGSWQAFIKFINPSEWIELRKGATEANAAVVDAPKSELASRTLARRGSTSRRPAAGE